MPYYTSRSVMITCQLFLLELCSRFPATQDLETAFPSTTNGQVMSDEGTFGRITFRLSFIAGQLRNFSFFTKTLLVFVGCLAILQVFFGRFTVYTEFIGLMSASIEALVPVPQMLKNASSHSVKGFSLAILAVWVFGDVFKMAYYFSTDSPIQFVACTVFQLCIDAVILCQIYLYRRNTMTSNTASGDVQLHYFGMNPPTGTLNSQDSKLDLVENDWKNGDRPGVPSDIIPTEPPPLATSNSAGQAVPMVISMPRASSSSVFPHITQLSGSRAVTPGESPTRVPGTA